MTGIFNKSMGHFLSSPPLPGNITATATKSPLWDLSHAIVGGSKPIVSEWEEMERYRETMAKLLFLAELLLGFSVLCCLLTLRLMQRSGCMVESNRAQSIIALENLPSTMDDERINDQGIEHQQGSRLKQSARHWRNMDGLLSKFGFGKKETPHNDIKDSMII